MSLDPLSGTLVAILQQLQCGDNPQAPPAQISTTLPRIKTPLREFLLIAVVNRALNLNLDHTNLTFVAKSLGYNLPCDGAPELNYMRKAPI